MSKKRKVSSAQLLQDAVALPKKPSRHKAAEYREVILVLAQKNLGHREISAFLEERGIRIHQTAISRYLRKHPPTQEEVDRTGTLPGRPIPGPIDKSADDAERKRKREELLARARKQRRVEPEEDDTDYSFLDVRGRPFRIRPKE